MVATPLAHSGVPRRISGLRARIPLTSQFIPAITPELSGLFYCPPSGFTDHEGERAEPQAHGYNKGKDNTGCEQKVEDTAMKKSTRLWKFERKHYWRVYWLRTVRQRSPRESFSNTKVPKDRVTCSFRSSMRGKGNPAHGQYL